jgi:hypothetical protein
MNWKGFERKMSCPIQVDIPPFAWRYNRTFSINIDVKLLRSGAVVDRHAV